MFEFNNKVKQQISGATIGTCIYMDKTETDFTKTQVFQPFIWLRYIDNIFLIWKHGEAELKSFLEKWNQFLPNLKFTYDSSQKKVAFLDLNFSFGNSCITTDLYTKSTDCLQYPNCSSAHPDHPKIPLFVAKLLDWEIFALMKGFSEACNRQEIMFFREGTLKGNDWFTNVKSGIRTEKKLGT